jgi:hypothetical protein
LDAIKLALLGYHPSHAKTAQAIFRLASGNPLTATVTLEGEGRNRPPISHVVGNEWRADSRGSISKRTFGPPPGTIPETPIVSLDPLAYFAATPRQRVDLIFAAANVDAGTVDLGALLKRLDELGVAYENQSLSNVVRWLDIMVERVEQARSDAAATEKRFASTVQSAPQAAEAFPEKLSETLAAKRKTLEALLATLATLAPSRKAVEKLEDEIAEARKRLELLDLEATSKANTIAEAAREKTKTLAHETCPVCGTLGRAWHTAFAAAMDEKIVRLGVERQNTVREINSTRDAIVDRKKKIETARLRAMKKDQKQRDKVNEEVAELREEIATLEETEERKIAADATEQHRATARRNWETARRDAERYGAAKKDLLAFRERLATNVVESVVRVALKFTDGIVDGRLAVVDGALAIHRNKDWWIPSETFSGTEQAIVFAGFQAALGAKAPVKLAILDELGRIDADNKTRLLQNVADAIADGTIDQFIGVDTEVPALLDSTSKTSYRVIER